MAINVDNEVILIVKIKQHILGGNSFNTELQQMIEVKKNIKVNITLLK